MIPAPVIFGLVFDMRCLVWRPTSCGDGACQEYDALTLRFWLFGLALVYKALGVLFAIALVVFWPCIQRRKEARRRALLAARQNSRASSRTHTTSSVQPNDPPQPQPQPPAGGLTIAAPTTHAQSSIARENLSQQMLAGADQSQGSAPAEPSAGGFSGNLIELTSFKPPASIAPGHMRSASDNTALVGVMAAASSPPHLVASASGAEFGSSSQSKLFPPSSAASHSTVASGAQSGQPAGDLRPFADDSGVSSAHPSSLNSSHSNTPFAAHDVPANKKAFGRHSSYGGGVTGFWHSLGKRLRPQRSTNSTSPGTSSRRSNQLKKMNDVTERGDAGGSNSTTSNADGRLTLAIETPSPSGLPSGRNGALMTAATGEFPADSASL